MNDEQKQQALRAQGIRDDAYSLNGPRDEAYCLEASGGRWRVYYRERGLKSGQKDFREKLEAFDYLESLLASDPTAQQP